MRNKLEKFGIDRVEVRMDPNANCGYDHPTVRFVKSETTAFLQKSFNVEFQRDPIDKRDYCFEHSVHEAQRFRDGPFGYNLDVGKRAYGVVYGGRVDSVPLDAFAWVAEIMAVVNRQKAEGSYSTLVAFLLQIRECGIEPVFVYGYTSDRKPIEWRDRGCGPLQTWLNGPDAMEILAIAAQKRFESAQQSAQHAAYS